MALSQSLLPQYVSEDEDAELPRTTTNVRARSKSWIMVMTFEDKISAEEYIKSQKIWSYNFKNRTVNGDKVYYRCNLVKSHNISCPANIHLLYDSTSNQIHLFKTIEDHDHVGKCISNQAKVSDEVMKRIQQMFDDFKKPKFIRQQLGDEGMAVPSQIKNFLLSIDQ